MSLYNIASLITFGSVFLSLSLLAIAIGLKLSVTVSIILSIFGLLYALLAGYDVLCTAEGNCTVWSWIKTVMIVLNSLFIMLVAIVIIVIEQAVFNSMTTVANAANAANAANDSAKKPSKKA